MRDFDNDYVFSLECEVEKLEKDLTDIEDWRSKYIELKEAVIDLLNSDGGDGVFDAVMLYKSRQHIKNII